MLTCFSRAADDDLEQIGAQCILAKAGIRGHNTTPAQ
jgi:hypothetical protein